MFLYHLIILYIFFKSPPPGISRFAVEVIPDGCADSAVAEDEEDEGDEEVGDGEGGHVGLLAPHGREVGVAGGGGGAARED